MGDRDIGSAVTSDLTGRQEDFSVATQVLDNAQDQKETMWFDDKWTQHLGYYKKIPELKTVIDVKERWTVGKGLFAEPEVELILDTIKGWGKDTFNSILDNLDRTLQISKIGAFAEIILDEDGNLINLKPLDPGSMRVIVDRKGMIIRYEQISRFKGGKNITFKPEQIFHLTEDRLGDEIHSTCAIVALEETILIINEATADWRKMMHRNVHPLRIFKCDTDDESEIAALKTKIENGLKDAEFMLVPMKVLEHEVAAVAPNATLNALPWIEFNIRKFFQLCGVPDIITGVSSSFTEASSKIAYLGWQQTVEQRQLYIEEQVLSQLNLVINLKFPASLQNEALSGSPQEDLGVEQPVLSSPEPKMDEQAIEPNDMTAEMEGRQ